MKLKAAALAAADSAADDLVVILDVSEMKFKSVTKAELAKMFRTAPEGVALPWTWDSGVAANPGTGKMRFNHATIASATGLEISETAFGGVAGANLLALATAGSLIIVRKVTGDGTQLAVFRAGATTDNGTHRSIVVTHVYSAGSIDDEDLVNVSILPTSFDKASIAGYSAVATQTLKHISGTLTWVTDA